VRPSLAQRQCSRRQEKFRCFQTCWTCFRFRQKIRRRTAPPRTGRTSGRAQQPPGVAEQVDVPENGPRRVCHAERERRPRSSLSPTRIKPERETDHADVGGNHQPHAALESQNAPLPASAETAAIHRTQRHARHYPIARPTGARCRVSAPEFARHGGEADATLIVVRTQDMLSPKDRQSPNGTGPQQHWLP